MKTLIYLFLFIVVMGIALIGFTFVAPPQIPQKIIIKKLDPKDAFAEKQSPSPARPVTAP